MRYLRLDNNTKLYLFLLIVSSLLSKSRGWRNNGWKRDAEENDDHLLNILKDHEIIPDLIDDAPHADILEVNSITKFYEYWKLYC